MNLPANPPQMNTGMRDTQFDSMNPRMPGHLLNQQPLQQQLHHQLQQQQQQQQGNPNLMNKKPVGMNQPQQPMPGHPGPMSVPSSLQQASVAASMGRSGSDMGLSSVQSSVANTTALSQAQTQLVSIILYKSCTYSNRQAWATACCVWSGFTLFATHPAVLETSADSEMDLFNFEDKIF